MITAQDELEKFLDRKGAVFSDALLNCAKAKTQGMIAHDKAIADLAMLIQHTLVLTDLHGRRRVLKEAEHVSRYAAKFSDIPANANPVSGLPFEEAVEDIITREPKLARSWQEVSKQYSTEHVFSMARSADMKITERVQEEVKALVEGGKSTYEAEQAILDIGTNA